MLYYRAAVTAAGHEKAGHGDFKNMIKRAGVPPECFPRYTGEDYKGKEKRTSLPPAGYRAKKEGVGQQSAL